MPKESNVKVLKITVICLYVTSPGDIRDETECNI